MKIKLSVMMCGLMLAVPLLAATLPVNALDYQAAQRAVAPLVKQMSLDQKLGQMVVAKFTFLISNQHLDYGLIQQYALGGMLAGGGEVPDGHGSVVAGLFNTSSYLHSTLSNWQMMTRAAQAQAPVVHLSDGQNVIIPLLMGVDAVHGDQLILGNVLFPQNIGLSVTHNPQLLRQIGHYTAANMQASGFNWAYAPTIAVLHNPNWGRSFESLGSVPSLVKADASAMVTGLQEVQNGKITGVLATIKHFIGDGATYNGADEGNDHVFDWQRFIEVNAQGYVGGIQAGAASLMVSYSAINNQPMSWNHYFNTQLLRSNKLAGIPFQGLIVSDYGAAYKAATQGLPATTQKIAYDLSLAKTVNSGVDMLMISNTTSYKNIAGFLAVLKQDVQAGLIKPQRIDEAVTHILTVKYLMGLLNKNPQGLWQVGNHLSASAMAAQEIHTALRAAEESLVLLKNHNAVLPLSSNKIKYVIFLGDSEVVARRDDGSMRHEVYADYNNLGAQSGGWTISWQGIEGNAFWHGKNKITSGAVTILEGMKKALPQATLLYPHYTTTTDMQVIAQERQAFLQQIKTIKDMNAHNTVVIGVLAATPYAEFMGDINVPYCRDNAKIFDQGCLYNLHLNPYLPDQQARSLAINYDHFSQQVLAEVRNRDMSIPLVSVLLSGRPRIVDQALATSDAFIAAWLPGTTGGTAIAQTLVGNYHFCNGNCARKNSPNTLTMPWVRNMSQLENYPVYNVGAGIVLYNDPLFTIGYGLPTK